MITVFGSLNVDLLFNLDRLPAPGETVLTREIVQLPGGKGANQATAAAKAGAPTRFVGCVGEDGLGAPVLASLTAAGCDVSGVREVPGATGTAVVMVERSGENQIVVGSGANMAVVASMLESVALGPGDTLVCQMEIPPEATAAALAAARRAGARTILNLAPARPLPPEVLADVDLLIVNEGEAAVLAGSAAPPLETARGLAAAHELTCVVTLGGDGALAVTPDGRGCRVGTLAVQAVDTVGAGDAFVGVLAASLDVGMGLPNALHRASVAAGLTCTRPGAAAALPDAAEIDGRLSALARPVDLGDG
ncbi:ribokinase [Thalassobaculum litoreum]|uniref:Ribokinase n=1 Tax=Thalassobaculum litoreum DSM 18839 TaxID=1123362 RepID=A0A8G2BFA0_9PROT|nr:ribokinase [Thalassobaculum litoreum]SDF25887.1 ribokinase [Thalassobaculum litoreum DSM 18839]